VINYGNEIRVEDMQVGEVSVRERKRKRKRERERELLIKWINEQLYYLCNNNFISFLHIDDITNIEIEQNVENVFKMSRKRSLSLRK